MKNLLSVILVTTLVAFSSGCATLMQNGPDNIPIATNPKGVNVYLDGQFIGTSPLIASVPRKSDGIFKFEMEGYETVTVDKDKVLSGWFVGDLILLSPLGLAIDLISSNQGKYSDAPMSVELKRKDGVASTVKKARTPANVKSE